MSNVKRWILDVECQMLYVVCCISNVKCHKSKVGQKDPGSGSSTQDQWSGSKLIIKDHKLSQSRCGHWWLPLYAPSPYLHVKFMAVYFLSLLTLRLALWILKHLPPTHITFQMFIKCVYFKSFTNLLQIFFKCLANFSFFVNNRDKLVHSLAAF